ncbi:MAG: PAS domain S-box protein [Desulfobulbus sp.]|nr:PAS domain S-box protein [Desulfobulbus sp.]
MCNRIINPEYNFDEIASEELRLMFWNICKHQEKIEFENKKMREKIEKLLFETSLNKILYDDMEIGVCIVDKNFVVTENNKFAEYFLCGEDCDLANVSLFQFVYISDQGKIREYFDEVFQGKKCCHCTLRLVHVDGGILWVQMAISICNTRDSYAYRVTITNIDAVKRAEGQLEQKLNDTLVVLDTQREVLDAMPFRLVWKDSNLRFIGCNMSFAQAAGFTSPDQLIGLNDFNLKWKDYAAQYRQEEYEVLRTGLARMHREERRVSPSGEREWFSVSRVPLRNTLGEVIGILGCFEEITHRKIAESATLQAEKLESLGELATAMAHHFNNVLMTILGNVAMAKALLPPSGSAFERLARAEESALKAEGVTRQFLTFSQDAFSVRQQVATFDFLDTWSRQALAGTHYRYEHIDVENVWDVFIDQEQVGAAFANILLNAGQAMGGEGLVRLHAENIVVDEDVPLPLEKGLYVKVTIVDQGDGIPREYLDKVFDPYFTTEKSNRGLGLAFAYSILQKNKGYLCVQSGEGVGTTCIMYLPASSSTVSAETEAESAEIRQHGNGRILVMDDDQTVCNLVSTMLEQLGYHAEIAINGEEVLEKYTVAHQAGTPFDAVILDLIVTSGMGGRDAMEKLKQVDSNVRGVVSSGYVHSSILTDYQGYGFMDVLPKPYRFSDLRKVLQRVCHAPEASACANGSPVESSISS